MTSQANLDKFNEFYKETYSNILRYIIIKCHNIIYIINIMTFNNNINDVNDIIQDVYLELWKIMNKKNIDDTNINSYLIGIAINKIKKYYSLVMRIRDISLFDKNNNDLEIIDKIDSSFDIESLLIKDEEWKSIWNFIKKKKNQDVPKVFYLYYKEEMTIKEISKLLNTKESYIKNLIYRTLNELCLYFKECD